MSSFFYVLIMFLLWIVNLLNDSAVGKNFHLPEITRTVFLVAIIIVFLLKKNSLANAALNTKNNLIFGGLFLVFILVPLVNGYGWIALDYLWVFCVVYLLSLVPVDEHTLKIVGIGYAVLGGAVLIIYRFGSILSGWNPNSIAMIGFNSFLFFVISFYQLQSLRGKLVIALVAVIYIVLINGTDSRSCMLFVTIGTLFALSILPFRILFGSKKALIIWLVVPLLVAIIAVAISKGPSMETLNKWSLEHFNKLFFSDRERIWNWGFEEFYKSPIFGSGNNEGFNVHNSLLGCLVVYGITGTLFWISSIYYLLAKSFSYKYDSIVIGSAISFMLVYLQQSVELGLLSSNPNVLPYLMLGIMLGRIRQLDSNSKEIDTIEPNQG